MWPRELPEMNAEVVVVTVSESPERIFDVFVMAKFTSTNFLSERGRANRYC